MDNLDQIMCVRYNIGYTCYKGYNKHQTNFKEIRPETMALIDEQYKDVVNTTVGVYATVITR